MKHTRLIPIIIVAIMLFNCFMPLTSVFANTVASKAIQLNGELYNFQDNKIHSDIPIELELQVISYAQ